MWNSEKDSKKIWAMMRMWLNKGKFLTINGTIKRIHKLRVKELLREKHLHCKSKKITFKKLKNEYNRVGNYYKYL